MTTVNRYLQVLGRMTESLNYTHRSFARKILRDLGEKGVRVQDYLKPYMTLPVASCQAGPQRAGAAQAGRTTHQPEHPMPLVIMRRQRHLVNTDPQRRCYYGEHYSSELVWGAWESLGAVEPAKAEDKLKFWRELNDYAVSQRGESARCEFKVEETPCTD